jgi:hypothetical protein
MFALAHRIEPERLFVILTAYMDESGTHGGSTRTAMAAIMGNVRQWSRFKAAFSPLKTKHKFSVLHMTDMRARNGEFKGLSDEACGALLDGVSSVCADHIAYGVKFLISEDAYKAYATDMPKKIRVDSRYGFCFRLCLDHILLEIERRFGRHKKFSDTRLHLVMESGHRNAGDAERIFSERKKQLGEAATLLASITFVGKSECDELMVADYLAYGAYHTDRDAPLPMPRAEIPRHLRERALLTHAEYGVEGASALRSQLIADYEARRAWGARRSISTDTPRV